MTAAISKDWFFHHFVPEVKESFKNLGLPEDTKAILLLDNCKAHPSVDERSFIQGLLNADCDVTDFQKKVYSKRCRLCYCTVLEPGKKYNTLKMLEKTLASWKPCI
ncbi:unnamed protein product [Parnassius mnemosyne]|uniref:DDE-1 domain-containing protein n=1 Tax=Parnassius mnemosyne TaxID=213953 RepID=A0AAV1M026_9NEOP